MNTHLLIDGDVIAFMAAAAVNHTVEDAFGYVQPFACIAEGIGAVENILYGLKAGLSADSFEVILSAPDNWRHQVDPGYKGNRKEVALPLLLGRLKDHLRERHAAYHWEGLEADDVLGIKMTTPGHTEDRLICVGRDKDFRSIPGLHHQLKQDVGRNREMLVREVTQWEADRFHLIQTLAGDRVDGYAGCPGLGMERAATIIDNPVRLLPKEGVKTRGVNKGESVTRWMAEPTRDYWACIVSHYRKAGLSEVEALVTARLARILRYGEYDPATKEVTLWTPDLIPNH